MAASMMQDMANSRPQTSVRPARNGDSGTLSPVELPVKVTNHDYEAQFQGIR